MRFVLFALWKLSKQFFSDPLSSAVFCYGKPSDRICWSAVHEQPLPLTSQKPTGGPSDVDQTPPPPFHLRS